MDQYIPLLNDFLPFEYPENDLTSQMTGQTRSEAIRDLLVKLFKNLTEEYPMVIVLDDVQWLDAASWILILAICQSITSNLFVVLSTRPQERNMAPQEFTKIKNLTSSQTLRLGMLAKAEITQLVIFIFLLLYLLIFEGL